MKMWGIFWQKKLAVLTSIWPAGKANLAVWTVKELANLQGSLHLSSCPTTAFEAT